MEKKERLQKAVDYVMYVRGYKNKGDVAAAMQINRSTLSSAMNDTQNFLTDSLLKRFCTVFPEINAEWLLDETGEMTDGPIILNTGNNNTQVSGNANTVTDIATINKALDEIAAQRRVTEKGQDQLTKAQEQIDRLLGIVENMRK